jgi:hypothetical protein
MSRIEMMMVRRNLLTCRDRLSVIRSEIKFRKLMLALKAGFNPDQPRADDGKWTADGGGPFNVAARGNEAICEAQYARDKITCNLVRTALCWAQAAERYAACLSGRSIPQLRF